MLYLKLNMGHTVDKRQKAQMNPLSYGSPLPIQLKVD